MLFVEVVLGKEKARSKIMHSTLNPKENQGPLFGNSVHFYFGKKRKFIE